jgi:hypothetical protein
VGHTRVAIGFGPGSCKALWADHNSKPHGFRSIVDDSIETGYCTYESKLVLRSTEIQPVFSPICLILQTLLLKHHSFFFFFAATAAQTFVCPLWLHYSGSGTTNGLLLPSRRVQGRSIFSFVEVLTVSLGGLQSQLTSSRVTSAVRQSNCSSRARGGLCNGDKHVHITPM